MTENLECVPPICEESFGFSKKYLLGELARWAVNQSPYYVPDNLDIVLRKVADLLPSYEFDGDYGFKLISTKDFHKWFFSIITQVPELIEWNVPKSGHKNGLIFCSAFDKPNADDDIVDLSALVNNIKRGLIQIWREGK